MRFAWPARADAQTNGSAHSEIAPQVEDNHHAVSDVLRAAIKSAATAYDALHGM